MKRVAVTLAAAALAAPAGCSTGDSAESPPDAAKPTSVGSCADLEGRPVTKRAACDGVPQPGRAGDLLWLPADGGGMLYGCPGGVWHFDPRTPSVTQMAKRAGC